MKKATWVNGKRKITGAWVYDWASQTFKIELDQKDTVTGINKHIEVKDDSPEWGNWKLLRV